MTSATPHPSRSFITTFTLTLVAIVGIFVVDTFLANMDRTESALEATRLFDEGKAALKKGDSLRAVDKINDAIEIDRSNKEYQLTLAEARVASGQTAEAETVLANLLDADPTDGIANLWMARVLAKEARPSDAISYYHRAIYGYWKDDAAANKRSARMELIDLLSQQPNSKEALLAELLPIEANPPVDLAARLRLGQLFLQAGSPSRAATVFQSILHASPSNTTARAGMGQAEFAGGNYRAAQRDFQLALETNHGDTTARHWLDLCNELLQLDPTLRGLDATERWHRSVALLDGVREDIGTCLTPDSPTDLQTLAGKAADAAKARPTGPHLSEAAESNLDLAEQLWQIRKKECRPPASTDSALALVLSRLAR